MASPSASVEPLALAVRLSPVSGVLGLMLTVGAVGGVLMVRTMLALALSPALSVAVTAMLWTPALRAVLEKLTLPLELAPCVENSPSMLENHERSMSVSASSRSPTVAEKECCRQDCTVSHRVDLRG